MKKAEAFTLIELLVVIAIIAILAAILFPVFATAREKARQTTCASNEKQLGLGILQYVEDYDEKFPCGIFDYGSSPMGWGWASQVYPYLKSTGAYHCPDDPTSVATSTALTLSPVSYDYNENLVLGTAAGFGGNAGVYASNTTGLPDLNAPAITILLVEVQGFQVAITDPHEGQGTLTKFQWSPSDPGNSPEWGTSGPGLFATGYFNGSNMSNSSQFLAPTGVHTGGANYAYCDGHVKWLRGSTVAWGIEYCGFSGACTATTNENPPGSQCAGTSVTTLPDGGHMLATYCPK